MDPVTFTTCGTRRRALLHDRFRAFAETSPRTLGCPSLLCRSCSRPCTRARAPARLPPRRGRGGTRPRRGRRLVRRSRSRGAPPEPRRACGIRSRAARPPRRRARQGTRRPRSWRARLRIGSSARRGQCRLAAARPGVVRVARSGGAGLVELVESLHARRLRAGRAGRGAPADDVAAGWSTSSRAPAASRCGWSSSATTSSRSERSRRSRSARSTSSTRPSSSRRASAHGDLELAALDEVDGDLVPLLDRPPDLVWQLDDVVGVWRGGRTRCARRRGHRSARRASALAAARVRGTAPGHRRPRPCRSRERARGDGPSGTTRARDLPAPG